MELCGHRGFAGATACVEEQGHEGPHVYGNFRQAIDDELRKDAMRYRWLRERLLGADFDWNESGVTVLAFEFPRNIGIGGNCDKNIDAAMAANVK